MVEEKMTPPMTFDSAEIRKLAERLAVTCVGEKYRRAFVFDVERIVRAALASAAAAPMPDAFGYEQDEESILSLIWQRNQWRSRALAVEPALKHFRDHVDVSSDECSYCKAEDEEVGAPAPAAEPPRMSFEDCGPLQPWRDSPRLSNRKRNE